MFCHHIDHEVVELQFRGAMRPSYGQWPSLVTHDKTPSVNIQVKQICLGHKSLCRAAWKIAKFVDPVGYSAGDERQIAMQPPSLLVGSRLISSLRRAYNMCFGCPDVPDLRGNKVSVGY